MRHDATPVVRLPELVQLRKRLIKCLYPPVKLRARARVGVEVEALLQRRRRLRRLGQQEVRELRDPQEERRRGRREVRQADQIPNRLLHVAAFERAVRAELAQLRRVRRDPERLGRRLHAHLVEARALALRGLLARDLALGHLEQQVARRGVAFDPRGVPLEHVPRGGPVALSSVDAAFHEQRAVESTARDLQDLVKVLQRIRVPAKRIVRCRSLIIE